MRFVVHGRVQGVGYRAATERQAKALGLQGWVRNRDDGAVEGVAAGAPDALAALHRWLAVGPEKAVVTSVEWLPTNEHPEPGFVVRRY
ncbi:MAG: acylphosphatase [Stagnimonas sp.]|nr:acylphosphatase [Stagnimonas sp.]